MEERKKWITGYNPAAGTSKIETNAIITERMIAIT